MGQCGNPTWLPHVWVRQATVHSGYGRFFPLGKPVLFSLFGNPQVVSVEINVMLGAIA